MADIYAGRLVLRDDCPEGWVSVHGGRVVDMDEGEPPEAPRAQGWIVPTFVNAHTHVADAFLRDVEGKPASIPELVGPGGWKHRQLAVARRPRQARGVHRYTGEMTATGTTRFLDFRENGASGARFLRDLWQGAPWMTAEGLDTVPVEPFVLGRPTLNDFDPDEADELLELVDGIGLSGMRDFPDAADLEAWAEAAQGARKPLALHVSEDKADDMDAVLALQPDFIVHMTAASRRDLVAAADEGVAVVACPRSNRFFGHRTPIEAMLEAGCHIALGTDNGMLQDGDLLAEARLLQEWCPEIPPDDLLRMASYGGRDLIGAADPLQKGAAADLLVLPGDPLRGLADKPGFRVPLDATGEDRA